MNENTQEYRDEELNKLITFTKTTDDVLEKILAMFQWSLENFNEKEENYSICPFNTGHRLPKKDVQHHIDTCLWRHEGYDKFDVELSEPTLSPDNPYTIKIDANLQSEILSKEKGQNTKILGVGDRMIPRTSNRIFSDFTSNERIAIYDYVIANTQKNNIGQDIADLNKTKEKKEEKSISYFELLAQERNLKRRRTKHRGVHTNKKSHVEVMREVLEEQMEIFKEYLSEQSTSQDVKKEAMNEIIDSSEHSLTSHANFEMKNYFPDQDETNFQKEKTNDRHYRKESRREHSNHRTERHESDYHSHRRDKYETKEERYRLKEKSKHRDRSHRDRSRDDKSRERKRHKSKDKYRSRSSERKDAKYDEYRCRKRSRSRNKY